MLIQPGTLFRNGGLRPALDLRLAGAAVLDSRISFTRPSTATDLLYTAASGAYNSFASGAPRFVAALGLLIEEGRTQSLGVTDTPATQTITLATGTYTHWMIGSGSLTSAAGTAVGSGFGASTQGTPKTITITTAGTVSFTVAGTVTRIQNESGAFPTSYIPNPGAVGTSVTRSADVATMTLPSIGIPASPTALTIIGKAKTAAGSGVTQDVFSLDDGTGNNRIQLRRNSSSNMDEAVVAGGVAQDASMGDMYTGAPNNTSVAFWFATSAASVAAQVVGQTKQVSTNAAAMPTGISLNIGGALGGGGLPWNSTIARLQIYNRRLPDATAAAIAGAL